jgi:glycosyltransferase involved in cell wall biosynthesis
LAPEQLREFASAFGIQWLGHVTDIHDVWRQANFAVLASRREGLPKSLLEAAACGRAMVATDAPGCREIAIDGETALTVPVDDVEALANALARMVSCQNWSHTWWNGSLVRQTGSPRSSVTRLWKT